MGCCGGEDDVGDDLLHENLLPPTGALQNPSSPSTISPMNSNFSALSTRDLLRSILELLDPSDLARAACVCKLWSSVASEREVLERTFASPWGLSHVLGTPSSLAFWRHRALAHFAISHCVRRRDSVASLALKYSVQVMDIMRLNNMMSDHGIYSRDRLLIPIGNPDILRGSTCYIERDVYAKREVAVLYLEGGPRGKVSSYLDSGSITSTGRKKILDSVRRSLGVDDGTAEYYMSISNGDPRMAIMEFSGDLRWEQQRSGL